MRPNGRQAAARYDGTAALKLTEPEADPVSAPRSTGQKSQHTKRGKRAAVTHTKENVVRPLAAYRGAPAALAAIFVLAAVVVVTLVSYAQLVMVNDQVVALRNELSDLKTEETKLSAQYELAYDLQEIENEMLTSGQMTKVQSAQTYTLELSEPDSVEYYQGSDVKARLTAMAESLVNGVKAYFAPQDTYDDAEASQASDSEEEPVQDTQPDTAAETPAS